LVGGTAQLPEQKTLLVFANVRAFQASNCLLHGHMARMLMFEQKKA
jgi:hypothetical protein